jgi:hypothetical protein
MDVNYERTNLEINADAAYADNSGRVAGVA